MSLVINLFRRSVLLGAFATIGCAGADGSSDPMAMEDTLEFDVNDQNLDTGFSVPNRSFGFANKFTNTPIPGLDVQTKGLCGGMVYSALDYWYANKTTPVQDYPPNAGQPLRQWIYNRQLASIATTAADWTALSLMTPDAMFKFGATQANVNILAASITAGRPIPVGLHQTEGKQDHQVLVVGYDLGAYDAAWGGYPKLKLRVYDPNYPKSQRTLQADTTGKYWYDPGQPASTRSKWAGFFYDDGYTSAVPPDVSVPSTGMAIKFRTGGQDLLGTTDMDVVLTMNDNSTVMFDHVNANGQWGTGSEEWVGLSVANPQNVKRVTVQIPFVLLDTWDIDELTVYNIANSVLSTRRVGRNGSPLASLGSFAAPSAGFDLPKTLIRAPGADFLNSTEDYYISYKTGDGSSWCASIYGNSFLHAPNCNWNQAHSDSYIAYVSSGQNWTATINNKTFTHTRNGQSHQDTRINYESGSTSWWAKVK